MNAHDQWKRGLAEGAERKRLERAEAWRVKNEKVQAIKAAFKAAKPKTVAEFYAIRAGILSPGDYGRVVTQAPSGKRGER